MNNNDLLLKRFVHTQSIIIQSVFSSPHGAVLSVTWFRVALQNTKTVVSTADVKSCQVSTPSLCHQQNSSVILGVF